MRRSLLVLSLVLALSLGVLALGAAEKASEPCEDRITALQAEVGALQRQLAEARRLNAQLRKALEQFEGTTPPGAFPFEFEGKKYFVLPAQPR